MKPSPERPLKRLAYLLADFPVLSETFIGNEIRAMERHGHRVLPIVMHRRDGSAQPEDYVLAERAVNLASLPKGFGAIFNPSLRPLLGGLRMTFGQQALPRASLFYHSMRIARLLRDRNIDHVHAHFAGGAAAHAIVAAKLAGATCSFVCHGHDVYAEPEDLPVKLRMADRVIAVCDDLARDLVGLEGQTRIATVPCGIDPERFTLTERAGHNGRLMFIGRMVEQKGLDDLIIALSLLPPAQRPGLDLVGDGPLRETIAAMAAKAGLPDLRFLGPKPAQWFAENGPHYRGLVAPFKIAPDGARDTGPLVVKEAMAMGLPVISTALMGVKEMLTPETGWMVPPSDPQALAAAISCLIAQPEQERCRQISAARARVVRHFTLEASATRLSHAFEVA